jgi:hypothetical protein
MGFEVLDSVDNYHVTHSTQFFAGIPLIHHGVLAAYPLSEEFSIQGGIVNGWDGATQEVDFNSNKAALAAINWASGDAMFNVSGYYGDDGLRPSFSNGFAGALPATFPLPCATGLPADPRTGGDCRGDDTAETLTLNANGQLQFTDTLLGWVEGTYGKQRVSSQQIAFLNGGVFTGPSAANSKNPTWYGLGGGLVLDFTEMFSGAGRFEYFNDKGNFRLGHGPFGNNTKHYEFTTTLRYNVRPNFFIRAEYRHDWVNTSGSRNPGNSDDVFFNRNGRLTSDQDFAIIEANLLFE